MRVDPSLPAARSTQPKQITKTRAYSVDLVDGRPEVAGAAPGPKVLVEEDTIHEEKGKSTLITGIGAGFIGGIGVAAVSIASGPLAPIIGGTIVTAAAAKIEMDKAVEKLLFLEAKNKKLD